MIGVSIFKSYIGSLVFSHVYISFAAVALHIAGNNLLGKLSPKPTYLLMVFCSTFLAYNFHRIVSKPVATNSVFPEKERWFLNNYSTMVVLFGLAIVSLLIVFLFYLDLPSILFLLHLSIISIFYNLPDKFLSPKLRLRKIPLLKVILVGYSWGALSVVLPALHLQISILSSEVIFLFISHAALIIALTIPFDFRDLEDDLQKNLITLPLLVGILPSKIVAILFAFLSIVLAQSHTLNLFYYLTIVLLLVLIVLSNYNRSELYFSLGLDGIIFLYSLSVLDLI